MVEEEVGGLVVESIDDLEQSIREKDVRMVILALPREAAQEITDRLVEVGVRALLSYVPVHLAVPDGVQVSYSDPVVQMQRMTYYLDP